MLIEKKVVIKNKLVQIANKFDCDISVRRGSQEINGKSIMGILMLAANKGSKILLKAEGPDSEAAVAELEKLLSGKFDNTIFKEAIPRTKKNISRKGGLISGEDKTSS
jgi:phosphocarrier protein